MNTEKQTRWREKVSQKRMIKTRRTVTDNIKTYDTTQKILQLFLGKLESSEKVYWT
jgi:methyl coenzyme M reductase subunit D